VSSVSSTACVNVSGAKLEMKIAGRRQVRFRLFVVTAMMASRALEQV